VKLYSYYRSSSAWRVRIVLAWKGIDYTYAPVNLKPGVSEQLSEDFCAVNPMQQVPTLEWVHHGELVRITQSVAISEYLEETHPTPPLMPADPLSRARVRQIVELIASGIQPHQNTGTLSQVGRLASDGVAHAWAQDAIRRALPALDALVRLHGGQHTVGDSVSLADAFLVPQLYNARRFELDLSPYPKLVELDAHASSLEPFQRAHPDRQIDSPAPSAERR
jgi:maleylpyruvate isomerase